MILIIHLQERALIESIFEMDYERNYVPGHESRYLSQIAVIIGCKNLTVNSLQAHNGLLNLAKTINKEVTNFKAREKGNAIRFQDVCARSRFSQGKRCQNSAILELSDSLMEKFRQEEVNLTYPVYFHPISREQIALPSVLGNISLKDNGANLKDATHLRLIYVLTNSSSLGKEPIKEWEKQALEMIQKKDWQDDRYEVFAINSKSLEKELTDNIHSVLIYIPIPVACLAVFIIFNGLNSASGQPLILPVLGLIIAVIATGAGFGYLMMFNLLPWQAINLASIFLLLGVGIDDTFVMLSALNHQGPIEPEGLEGAMAQTYREAAVSITITSLTNILSFGLGIWLPSFKTVKIFCAYTAVGLFCVYVLTLTAFGPLIVIFHRIRPRNPQIHAEQQPPEENNS